MRKIFLFLIIGLISCNNAGEYHKRAILFEEKGNYEEAIFYLNKAIQKDPHYIDAYFDRGVDKSILGDYRGAIEDYTSIMKLDSTIVLAYYNRAKNYNRTFEHRKAYDDITLAFNLATQNRLGDVYLVMVDDKYAVEMEEIVFERGVTFFYMDSLYKAISDLSYCIEKNDVEAFYWRGLSYLKINELSKGCEDLQKAASFGIMDSQRVYLEYCNNSVNED